MDYRGKLYANALKTGFISSYVVGDLEVAYMHKVWTVSSAVRNIADTTYVVASNNVAGWSETAASSPTSACAPG